MKDRQASRGGIWRTSSFGSAPDPSPAELAALGEHMRRCDLLRDTALPLGSAAEKLRRFAGPRIVTIIVALALLSVLASLVLS